jgi:hypothetical protein
MNTDNTQDANEPSPASAGSHAAVAWAVWYPEGTALGAYFTDDERKADSWRDAGATVVPLYRYPALTNEEREAVEWFAGLRPNRPQGARTRLKSLLERLG